MGDIDALDRVRKNETVDADHRRDRQLLGEPESNDVEIDRFLIRFCKKLDPPDSRSAIASEWSFQMLIGAPIARLPSVMTIGRPRPAAL
jgi:hypothetical protein